MLSSRQLYYAVHGEKAPRKPPQRSKSLRGPARSWKYRGWIRSLESCVSGNSGCEAAHTGTDGGMRQKSSDYSCVPLTHDEHMELHRIGRKDFEARHDVHLADVVRRLNSTWFQFSKEVK